MSILANKRNLDGSLGELEKVFEGETEAEKVERLENDNAQLIYEGMMTALEMDAVKNSQAELIYLLMQKGVL